MLLFFFLFSIVGWYIQVAMRKVFDFFFLYHGAALPQKKPLLHHTIFKNLIRVFNSLR